MTALLPSMARRLFVSTVVPVMDYASTVWSHTAAASQGAFGTIQKMGAKAVIGVFKTVAREVAEAEANLQPVKERHKIKAAKTWIDLLTLPQSNPLRADRVRQHRRFCSPLSRLKNAAGKIAGGKLETIEPYIVTPWEKRVDLKKLSEGEKISSRVSEIVKNRGIVVLTTAAERKGSLAYGGSFLTEKDMSIQFSKRCGSKEKENPYTAELAATAEGLEMLATIIERRRKCETGKLVVVSCNLAMLQAISKPTRQSGQRFLKRIYQAFQKISSRGIELEGIWFRASDDLNERNELKKIVKKKLYSLSVTGETQLAKPTTIRRIIGKIKNGREIADGVGRTIRELDRSFPGEHTLKLYKTLQKREAMALAQLRTGANHLNSYLFKIGISERDECGCGRNKETVKHFLFTCRRWDKQREELIRKWPQEIGNTSFFLGGRTTEEEKDWEPNWAAVRAAVRFTMATARFCVTVE